MSVGQRRVLVVDDMKSVRMIVRNVLEEDPNIRVVGEARNAFEAREKLKQLTPDVMTLDVEMPVMRGDIFLKQIMTLRPLPVIVLSHFITRNCRLAKSMIEDGAIDCIEKPKNLRGDSLGEFGKRLRKSVLEAQLANIPHAPVQSPKPRGKFDWNGKYVFVGASTGGVSALEQVFRAFPADCPPVLVAQHIPGQFTPGLAAWLDGKVTPKVSLAREGMKMVAGTILISPGGHQNTQISPTKNPAVRLAEHNRDIAFCPSVDLLFRSAAHLGKDAVAVLLTGMGSDGAQGLKSILDSGGTTFAQDEASSVVFGMPKAAHHIGAVQEMLDLSLIGDRILDECSKKGIRHDR